MRVITPQDKIRPGTRKWELNQVYRRTRGNRAAVHKANAAFAYSEQYGEKGPCKDSTVDSWCNDWDNMNPHIGAAMWIIAMLVGFVIWWPIGAMILASITFVALCQQITGYRQPHRRRSASRCGRRRRHATGVRCR